VCEHYAHFGPTLITEKLAEKHEVVLSRETLESIDTLAEPTRP
jgi:hypothetical protein